MTKQEWKTHHGFNDEDMEQISIVKEIFNGTILSVTDMPRNANGEVIPFAEQRSSNRYRV